MTRMEKEEFINVLRNELRQYRTENKNTFLKKKQKEDAVAFLEREAERTIAYANDLIKKACYMVSMNEVDDLVDEASYLFSLADACAYTAGRINKEYYA